MTELSIKLSSLLKLGLLVILSGLSDATWSTAIPILKLKLIVRSFEV